MKIDIITLFPEMFQGPFDESILRRAQDKKLVEIKVHNLRNWADDKRGTVDDRPYGGGVGMVMRVDIIDRALSAISNQQSTIKKKKIILLSPRGKPFNQQRAQEISKLDHLILLCGHYEGVDERVSEHLVDEEISIGDYVLTGGEIPAMVIIDAVVRLIPEVLEKPEATISESHSPLSTSHFPLLEYPQYTRPEDFQGWKVPEILLSGDHKKIEDWRGRKALEKTKESRPDLLKKI
ncbi:MAG: tRNA (guanosine(37)-N1)-methyltransferase TrmD [bacterium]|nr:tRNA (guanosine(37)-N1)-methyltransferase TrmD [bacterium]